MNKYSTFGVKGMEVVGSIGSLPEEEDHDQVLLVDIEIKSKDLKDLNEYKMKEAATSILKTGYADVYQYAEKLCDTLKTNFGADEVTVTVCKTSSPIGIPTYYTIKK